MNGSLFSPIAVVCQDLAGDMLNRPSRSKETLASMRPKFSVVNQENYVRIKP